MQTNEKGRGGKRQEALRGPENGNGQPPYVSILVPVYNAEAYLRECLDSILAQSFRDFELILLDDGSTDQSCAICEEYAAADSRIRVLHQENQGNGKTRDRLLRLSRGEYLLYVDADDTIVPELLTLTTDRVRETGCDVVIFGYRKVTETGAMISEYASLYPDGTGFDRDSKYRLYRDFVCGNGLNNMWSKLVKRSLYQDVLDTEDELYARSINGEDRLRTISILEHAEKVSYIARPLYLYRQNSGSFLHNYKLEYLGNTLLVNKRVLDMLKREGLGQDPKLLRDWYQNGALDIINFIYNTAAGPGYRIPELLSAYRRYLETDACEEIRAGIRNPAGGPLQQAVYALFRRRLYLPMILLIRARYAHRRRLFRSGKCG